MTTAPIVLVPGFWLGGWAWDEVAAALRRRGSDLVKPSRPIGGAQAIAIDWNQGVLIGASDPRKDGCALGY